MMRRLLPAVIIIPPILGYLRTLGENAGWYGPAFGRALLVCSIVLVPGALIYRAAVRLDRVDLKRQRTEMERARLAALVDLSSDAIVVRTLNGQIRFWSRGAQQLYGFSSEEAVGRLSHDLLRTGFPKPLAQIDADLRGADFWAGELEHRAQDGRSITVLSRWQLTPARGSDELEVLETNTDISESKLARERLHIQAERLSLLDRSTRAIGERQDPRSIFQVAIRSLEDHLGIDFGCICLYEPASSVFEVACVGIRSRELALDLALAEHARVSVSQNGLALCVQGQLIYEPDISDSTFPFLARLARAGLRSLVIAPLSAEKNVFGVLIVARRAADGFPSADCEFLRQLSDHLALAAHQAQLYSALQRAYDDLRQTQEAVMQQERLRALGQMASGVAHDINNALSPAALYVQALLDRDQSLSPAAREQLTVVQKAIEGVAHTVDRLRMFSRPHQPEHPLTAVNLNSLLQQVRELTRSRWSTIPRERGVVIELKSELAPDLPPILAAENEIRDAVINLVFNAADAMPAGGTVTLRTRLEASSQLPKADRAVIVEIADTGVGMTEEVRKRCTEPFFTTKGEHGTGLGLAMVYGTLQRHGASLEIQSELGAGTVVRLTFPSAASTGESHEPAEIKPVRDLRILLIDDDPLLHEPLRNVLEVDGHTVTVADGGRKGVDEFIAARQRGDAFSVVITDLGMPNMDGRAVAAAVKTSSPQTPVILLTGWGRRIQSEGALPAHVDRVLAKPPRLAELRSALADLL